jgi:superfamily II DNA or RNA helicase
MPYFQDQYARISYPDGNPGLRTAQLGAIHAIAAHFTTRKEPAIVVMPTGTGKTAVLAMAPFVLKAQRVLVVTGSRVVRDQIFEEFDTLGRLKDLAVLPLATPTPAVVEVSSNVTDAQGWEDFREAEVVVVAPSSASPVMEAVAPPPPDLFDLVLVDEAHHSRAKTWEALIESFPNAKRILFTATPYRRDQRELRGRLVYVYPVAKALEDGIFGKIEYIPVAEGAAEHESDIALATEAQRILLEDRRERPGSLLMVRTDLRTRADELKDLYEEHTDLKLQVVHGGHTFKHVKTVIRKLRANELDGVICVNMLGEGFNLPALKVAAIHAPLKSLGVTLQFIGRFARVEGEEAGVPAKFLAVPSTVKHQLDMLYVEGADWQKLITELAETRIEREVENREANETFEEPTVSDADLEELSLGSLRPFFHVKVFEVHGDVDLHCELGSELKPVYRRASPDLSADLFVTKDIIKPKWALSQVLDGHEHNLFIVYFDEASRLLFINSSEKSELVYMAIANSYCDRPPSPLPLDKVNKALVDLVDFEFFNIGMRRTYARSNLDSYKIFTGEHPHKSIVRRDGKMYHRGHLYGTAKQGGEAITIGYSSGAKIWSNKYDNLASLIAWCKTLAGRIISDRIVETHSFVDLIGTGETVTEIPTGVVAAGWHTSIYDIPRTGTFTVIAGGVAQTCDLTDFDLEIDVEASDDENIKFTVTNDVMSLGINFSLETARYFTSDDAACERFTIEIGRNHVTLLDFMNLYPPTFYFADFASLEGNQYFRMREVSAFDPEAHMEIVDWDGENVDIETEAHEPAAGKKNILTYLGERFDAGDDQVVLLDDGAGEIADFLTIHSTPDLITVRLYHAKKSHGVGATLADAQVVCAQVVKSMVWVNNNDLLKQIRHRLTLVKPRLVKGDINTVRDAIEAMKTVRTKWEIVIVQPGFEKATLPNDIGHILAAANDYITGELCEPLRVWCSP